jgi:hypothetical protein
MGNEFFSEDWAMTEALDQGVYTACVTQIG